MGLAHIFIRDFMGAFVETNLILEESALGWPNIKNNRKI
jgi:hypothetical protein